jgi:mono/diheme cytochrome c family protein
MSSVKTVVKVAALLAIPLLVAAFARTGSSSGGRSAPPTKAQILRGRAVVIEHDCAGCHGGSNPGDAGWLQGVRSPQQEFPMGPCGKLAAVMQGKDPNAVDPKDAVCFITRPKNLTPDKLTGIGSFTERQIFNALRYGLRPEDTPDMQITSSTPGKGNFPSNPKYLAPPMPWTAWRHMSDADLWAVAAYLKYGLKPVRNKVQDSEGPPDFWASGYTVDKIGPYPSPAFPTANEVAVTGAAKK